MDKTMAAQEKEWQADSDMRTLIEAEKIKKDKPRFRRAMKKAKEQRDQLAQVMSNGKEK